MARIKIIDDDKELSQNLAEIIRKEGHEVTILNSMETALDSLMKNKPDLLILDVMFPENPVAGFELARTIRQRKAIANLPILMLTGVNQEFPMDFSDEDIDPNWLPIQAFIEKPAKPVRLIKKINELLKKAN